jgi:hypothetical protein
MQYVAHETVLNAPLTNGSTVRADLEFALERYNSPRARRELLEGPECPECFAYLLPHAHALLGRSGMSESGFAPLKWTELTAYQQETVWTFSAWEKDALMRLDTALRTPPPEPTKPAVEEPEDVADDRPRRRLRSAH